MEMGRWEMAAVWCASGSIWDLSEGRIGGEGGEGIGGERVERTGGSG